MHVDYIENGVVCVSSEEIYKKIQKIIPENKRILCDEPMSKHTSFKIGGPADYYIIIETEKELKGILNLAKQVNLPITIVGNGTNILVRDNGIRGFVLRINFGEFKINRTKNYAEIKIGSGFQVAKLSRIGLNEELKGLEFLCGIPGTIGGAIRMNAGAYGGEIKDILVSVKYMDYDGHIFKSKAEELDLSYRHSIFCDNPWIIIEAIFKVEYGNKGEIEKIMKENQASRIAKQPVEYASAGSTFKRPEGRFVGQMVEESGLKGFRIGGAEVSVKHAGFIVNVDHATASDVLQLIEYIQKKILENYNVQLIPEVLVLGEV